MADLIEMQVGIAMDALRAMRDAEVENLQGQMRSANSNQRKQFERKLRALEEEMEAEARAKVEAEIGAKTVGQMGSIMKVMQSFIGGTISVRMLACGVDHPEFGFAGSLLGRDEYLQREREELYSRYGSVLGGWTALMQIAHIPSEAATTSARDFRSSEWGDLAAGGNINRAAFEGAAAKLLQMMEAIGVAEGPRWPTISVIPLAIYRPVPGSRDPSEGSSAECGQWSDEAGRPLP